LNEDEDLLVMKLHFSANQNCADGQKSDVGSDSVGRGMCVPLVATLKDSRLREGLDTANSRSLSFFFSYMAC
jgi:hypothetical protein